MCGIIAAFNTKTKRKTESANEFVINQYEEQYKRGTEGFGIIRIDKKGDVEVDRACQGIKFLLDLYTKKSDMIIAHHRTPTSTSNKLDQTHPMFVSNKLLKFNYLVVHNGVITNTIDLHKKHNELGFEYTTEYGEEWGTKGYEYTRSKWNDSESLAIELGLFIEKKISAIGLDNNAAFIVLQTDKKTGKATQVFFGKNGNCSVLNMSKEKGRLRLSSEGEGEAVEENKLYSFKPSDISMYLSKKDMVFKKAEVIPTIPATTITTPTVATTTKPIDFENNTKLIEAANRTNIVVMRNWSTADQWNDMSDTEIISVPNQAGYIEEVQADFKEEIKDATSTELTHMIDDRLDAELEHVGELLADYKQQLLLRRFNQNEEMQYSRQVFRIVRAMKEITEMADQAYLEKAQEEAEEEIVEYNAGYESGYGFKERDLITDEEAEEHIRGRHNHRHHNLMV